ncbi:hypothetical protein EDD33_1086 [Nocardioides aurantiacus]|uniref:Uncharacterized protein n=1 Tax=Nocardioides aurantiacus TaxID=86796 RepID=A0A3N2CRV8_9ACTN|nr:hypothetical protein EDD33_1086 [Nocardioides aurantiacus]
MPPCARRADRHARGGIGWLHSSRALHAGYTLCFSWLLLFAGRLSIRIGAGRALAMPGQRTAEHKGFSRS